MRLQSTYFYQGAFLFLVGSLVVQMFFTACTRREKTMEDKTAYAGNDDKYQQKFAVEFEAGEKPIRYGYHYVVSAIPDGYRVRVFHPEKKTLTRVETYGELNLMMLNGPYKSFWDDGSIYEQGNYQDGRKEGLWVESEPGRGKSSSGMYAGHRKEGEWTQLDSNGLKESIYNYHDNQLEGKFYLFDSAGQKINEGLYKSDSLITEVFPQPKLINPFLKSCQSSSMSDVYTCSETALQSIVNTNLEYPALARENHIEGTAVVQWDVMADGTGANIRVPQGLCDEIEAECIRVFKLTGNWVPAYKDGQAVKYTMSMPISFRLQ